MKALERLREQLKKDYPGNQPVFGKAPASPEETKFFVEGIVIPAFELIGKEFDSLHISVNIRRFPHVTKLEIGDGCSLFSLSIKTGRKNSGVTLTIDYRDYSVSSKYHKMRTILEATYDLSRVTQTLTEEMIVDTFVESFSSRRDHLRRIVEAELNDEREKTELIREERRAKLIELKKQNEEFDPEDEFKKYLDSLGHTDMTASMNSSGGYYDGD